MATEVFTKASIITKSQMGERQTLGILGPPRSGKTVMANLMAWQVWQQGVEVFHLGNLGFGNVLDIEWLADQDPEILSNCLVYLDEVKAIAPGQRSATAFQLLFANNIVQAGHQGVTLLYTGINDRSLNPTLSDLTDRVYWVNARKWKFTPHVGMTCAQAEWRLEKHHHCPAWVTGTSRMEKKLTKQHRDPGPGCYDCREFDTRHDVGFKMVYQENSPATTGFRMLGSVHCAQRFYGLGNTKHKVDATQSFLFGTEEIRARAKQAKFDEVRDVVDRLAGQVETLSLAQILVATNAKGLDLTNNELAGHLRDLGIPKRTKLGVAKYHIEEWADSAVDISALMVD